MKVTACQCLEPGWCPRHRCVKTVTLFELCRRSTAFFTLWEQGQGPGQGAGGGLNPVPKYLCRHQGAEVRQETCPSCRGHVRIKVFACQRHGECTSVRAVPGVACCLFCGDYAADDLPTRSEA
jgi:hypothetical protein